MTLPIIPSSKVTEYLVNNVLNDKKINPHKALILLDLDETIFIKTLNPNIKDIPPNFSYYWLNHLLDDTEIHHKHLYIDMRNLGVWLFHTLPELKKCNAVIEPNVASNIKKLTQKGFTVLGCTARSPEEHQQTQKELNQFKIQFSNSKSYQTNLKKNPDCMLKDGVIYVSQQFSRVGWVAKEDAVIKLISKKVNNLHQFETIIFADDKKTIVEKFHNALKEAYPTKHIIVIHSTFTPFDKKNKAPEVSLVEKTVYKIITGILSHAPQKKQIGVRNNPYFIILKNRYGNAEK